MIGGDSINDYKLQECVGEGAYGRVYRSVGVDKQTYALKVIQISPKTKEKMREQGIILASLKHANVLWAREFFYYQQEKYFVIVTEFCNNGSLEDKIQELPSSQLYPVMIGIAQGLKYLHDKNIIHRDIKPENILLTNWVPKIADMGLAKVVKAMRATTKIGTPFYMAFQIFQSDYDFSADIWALGIIFLELALKQRIFQMLKGQQIPSKRPTFPTQQLLNEIQDTKLRNIVSLMLKHVPSERISIQEVVDILTDNITVNSQQFQNSKRAARNTYRDVVEDCYIKTKDYFYCKYTLRFIRKLYEKNMVQIVGQAQLNNRKALYILAEMYNLGCGMPRSEEKAEQTLMRAYELEEPLSCYELYLSSTSPYEKYQYLIYGKMLYNDERCLNKLAQNYLQGLQGKDIDYQQAYEILLDLLGKDYPPAYYLMGKLSSIKNTQFYNIQKSKDFFIKGGQLGSIKCKIKLVQQIFKQKKYAQCLQMCNENQYQQQEMDKKDVLGLHYLRARCLKRLNNEKCVQYYRRCIQLDDDNMEKDYRGQIAEYYASISNAPQAINFYNEAILRIINRFQQIQASQYSKKRLEYLCSEIYLIYCEEQMLDQAFQIAEISSNLGHQNGRADYGYMIYFGMGTAQRKQQGRQILQKLCQEENSAALQYMQIIMKK